MVTIQSFLETAVRTLTQSGIGTGRLDALVLLEDVTGKTRTHLLAHPELKLTHEQAETLQNLLKRRSQHEPLAYVRAKTEFYGRDFIVTRDVLEPRPESETMIDLLKSTFARSERANVVDVGTGSGALAVTAKLEVPEATVIGLDIDPKCLVVARQNAQKHGVHIDFVQSNLLQKSPVFSPQSPVFILANLPYVPDDYTVNEAAEWEPKHAIFGGPDGLDLYRDLFVQLATADYQVPVFVLTESLPFQHKALQNIAVAQNFMLKAEFDFIQLFEKA